MIYTRRSGTEKNKTFIKAMAFYFTMLPMGALNVGVFGSLLRIIGLVPVAIWFAEHHDTEKEKRIMYLMFFVFWCVLSLLWTVNLSASFQRVFSYGAFLALMSAVNAYEYTNANLFFLKKCLVWSSRITILFVILFTGFIEGRLRLSGAINEDPNYLCMYFSFGIACCMEIICEGSLFRKKILAIFELMIYMYLILSTGSRGGALSVAVIIVGSFFLTERKKDRTLRNFMVKCTIILAGTVGAVILSGLVSKDMLERYRLMLIVASAGSGRLDIWNDAIQTFRNAGFFRQLFGFGTGTAKTVSELYSFSRITVVHNMFLENLIEGGVIGLAFYMIYVFGIWNSARKSSSIFALSIINGMIVMSLSASIYAFKPYWNIMIYILCLQKRRDCLAAAKEKDK